MRLHFYVKGIFFTLFLSNSFVFAQSSEGFLDKTVERFRQNNIKNEKVYLHINKTVFTNDEDIWFKAYLVDDTFHKPSSISTNIHVELINSNLEILESRNIYLRNGVGAGDFSLPKSIKSGSYIIRAYTEFMRNLDSEFFYKRPLKIINLDDSIHRGKQISESHKSIDVQFFPEGGDLVNNLVSIIAFKAVDKYNNGIDVSGIIVNNKGDTVTSFSSSKFGMGKFVLVPKTDESYDAIVFHKQNSFKLKIPKSKPSGYVMTVKNAKDEVSIIVRSNQSKSMKNSFIIGHVRGNIFSAFRVSNDKDYIYVTIPVGDIPSGIAHFTFFDENGNPRAERLIYSKNESSEVDLNIKGLSDSYSEREKAKFELSLSNIREDFSYGNVSISVNNVNIQHSNSYVTNIKNYLLLRSDLKGKLEHVDYYFDKENKDSFEVLDLLMLTQGWRRFEWEEILGEEPKPLKYTPEKGFNISGQLLDFRNQKKPVKGEVTLTILEDMSIRGTKETLEDGYFSFELGEIMDSITIVLNAYRIKKSKLRKNYPILISLGDREIPELELSNNILNDYNTSSSYDDNVLAYILEKNSKIRKIDSVFNPKIIILDEVKVIDNRSLKDKDPYYRQGQLYSKPSNRIVLDTISTSAALNFLQIIGNRIPGVRVSDDGILIRGQSTFGFADGVGPLYVIDGVSADFQSAITIPPSIISHIDILKAADAALYGNRGAGGVVLIYTNENKTNASIDPLKIHSNVLNIKHPGYYKARKFYIPKFKDEKEIRKPDFRHTLYWNPEVLINGDGKSSFEFNTSDEKGTYLIQIEGITNNGEVISEQSLFTVE